MRRRDFIKAVVGSFAASPLAVRAQQRALPTIGLLSSRSPAVDAHLIALIRQGLNETGFVEGQNVAIDYRTGSDPIRTGLVNNLHRPGGNITGVSTLLAETEAKRLELLQELRLMR